MFTSYFGFKEAEDSSMSNHSDVAFKFRISAMCKFSSVTVPDSGVTGVSRVRSKWMEELIRFKSQNTE